MYSDAMASFWREWIVNYDVAHQYNLSQQTAQTGRHLLRQTSNWFRIHYQNFLSAHAMLPAKFDFPQCAGPFVSYWSWFFSFCC